MGNGRKFEVQSVQLLFTFTVLLYQDENKPCLKKYRQADSDTIAHSIVTDIKLHHFFHFHEKRQCLSPLFCSLAMLCLQHSASKIFTFTYYSWKNYPIGE